MKRWMLRGAGPLLAGLVLLLLLTGGIALPTQAGPLGRKMAPHQGTPTPSPTPPPTGSPTATPAASSTPAVTGTPPPCSSRPWPVMTKGSR
jgi:hypothetical protein